LTYALIGKKKTNDKTQLSASLPWGVQNPKKQKQKKQKNDRKPKKNKKTKTTYRARMPVT
jgi:hypothetical protein